MLGNATARIVLCLLMEVSALWFHGQTLNDRGKSLVPSNATARIALSLLMEVSALWLHGQTLTQSPVLTSACVTDRQTDKQNCHSIQCLHASHAQSKQTSDVHVSQLPICNELRWDSCVNTPVNSFADTATSDVNVYHTNKRKTASVIKTQHDVSSKLQVECDFRLIHGTTISTQCSWKLTLNVFSSLLFVSFSQCTFYITCTHVHVCSWVGDALQATMPSCYSHYYHRH